MRTRLLMALTYLQGCRYNLQMEIFRSRECSTGYQLMIVTSRGNGPSAFFCDSGNRMDRVEVI